MKPTPPKYLNLPIPIALALFACLASALAAVAFLGFSSERADAYVYWGAWDHNSYTGYVGRARLDGTHKDRGFIQGRGIRPMAIAVDARHIYWSNVNRGGGYSNSIGRARLDGTKVERRFIDHVGWVYGLAVAGRHIYWSPLPHTSIARATRDGTEVDPNFITVGPGRGVQEIQARGGYLYWASPFTADYVGSGLIGRARLDGSEVEPDFISGRLWNPTGLAVSSSDVYWTRMYGLGRRGPAIGKAAIDGSFFDNAFITDAQKGSSLALDDRFLYWGQHSHGGKDIVRARLDGSRVKTLLRLPQDRTFRLSVEVDGRGPG